jgi:hypothetical protein
MHPVLAVVKELKLEDRKTINRIFDNHRRFHNAIQDKVYGEPKQFFTRQLILHFVHLHNSCQKPEDKIHLLDPKASDIELITALDEFDRDTEKSDQVGKAVRDVRKKFDYAKPEQRAEAESLLLAAVSLLEAEAILQRAKWDVLRRDLRNNENLFPNFIKARYSDAGWQTMLEFSEKIQKLLFNVEVPPSLESFEEGAQLSDVQESWELDSNEDIQLSLEERAEDCLRSLIEITKMVAELEQSEVLDVLSECRNVVKQAKGKDTADEDDQLDGDVHDHPGIGEAVVFLVRDYRQYAAELGEDIDERVYAKAAEFVEFIESKLETEMYVRRPWGLKDEWRNYYTDTILDTEQFAMCLRDYARKVDDRNWDFDQRVLEALEVLIEQGKGKVDIEVEEDESLSSRNLHSWGEQGRISVLIRGYSQLMKEKGRQPADEVLKIAQIIIERANEQYQDQVEDAESYHDCEGYGDLLDENPIASSSDGYIISCELDPLDRCETEIDDRKLHPINEDPEAEAEAESESEVSIINGESHGVMLTNDDEEIYKKKHDQL